MNKHYDTPRIGNPFAFKRTAPKPRTLASVPTTAPRDQSPAAGVTVTRGLFDLIAILGWLYLAIIAAAILSIVLAAPAGPFIAPGILLGGVVLALPGFFIIAFARVSRSIVDTAENTRRLVELMESRLNSQTNV